MESYLTPAQSQSFSLEIKRSRFISTIAHASSRAEAKAFIQTIQQQYPDARHNCWAFIAGAPNDLYGLDQSDDGEPKDTAGKPMLNVLQHSGFGHVVLVVTRYFGGIKLGAGGLVRAYSQAASLAVGGVETREYLVRESLQLTLPYSFLGQCEYWLEAHDIQIVDKLFNNDITMTLAVPLSRVDELKKYIEGAGNGQMSLSESESPFSK